MAAAAARARRADEPKVKSDAYTGLLVISLCAMILGCVLLYLDWSQYPESKPPALPTLSLPKAGTP